MTDLAGKQLRGYRVLRRLGRGAMAEVYLAEQASLGRQVALKVLNADLAGDPSYVERFDHEARAAAGLVHASIVQIYEVGRENGVHFIAQEYVPGRTLGELIKRQGALSAAQTLDILRQVTAALAKADECGIVHRDIKPENILLAAGGEVKVADFGLARTLNTEGKNQLTQVGVALGTPLYMSPEQIEGRALDGRSDIYSLGVTAYHMLAGRPPFTGDTPLAVAVGHLNESPPPLADQVADVPTALADVVHRMMAKQADDRPAGAAALLAELRELASQAASEGWGSGPENWTAAELSASATVTPDITQRLQVAMRADTGQPTTKVRRRTWIAVVMLGLLAGIVFSAITRPRWLLAGVEAGPPKQESVVAQIYHANMANTEAAWLAVERYFPQADEFDLNLARQGLVRYYLLEAEQPFRAIRPLETLKNSSAADESVEAFAKAGLTVAHAQRHRWRLAQRELAKLDSKLITALAEYDPRMSQLFQQARNVINENL